MSNESENNNDENARTPKTGLDLEVQVIKGANGWLSRLPDSRSRVRVIRFLLSSAEEEPVGHRAPEAKPARQVEEDSGSLFE